MISSSLMSINPDIPEAHALRGWYEASTHEFPNNLFAFLLGSMQLVQNKASNPIPTLQCQVDLLNSIAHKAVL